MPGILSCDRCRDKPRLQPSIHAGFRAATHAPFRKGETCQRLLIELSDEPAPWEAAAIFEDSWFMRHAVSFPPHCRLLGTTAFLGILAQLGIIESTDQVLAQNRQVRPSTKL